MVNSAQQGCQVQKFSTFCAGLGVGKWQNRIFLAKSQMAILPHTGYKQTHPVNKDLMIEIDQKCNEWNKQLPILLFFFCIFLYSYFENKELFIKNRLFFSAQF